MMTTRTADRPRPLHTSRPSLAAIACVGALLGACDDDARPTTARTGQLLVNDAPVCPKDRVVAIATTASCPLEIKATGGRWLGGNLYDAGAELPQALAKVCGYQWAPKYVDDPAPPDPSKFSGPGFASHGSDCEVVWPEADALSTTLAEPLKAAFYAHAGRVTGTPVTPGKVVVAVVDTASNSAVTMTSDHGDNMAGIVTGMACPNASCNVSLDRSLALPLIEGEPDWQAGGYYGSQGHLAQAIHGAVKRWKQRGDGSKLVINLSVGWEASKFGGEGPTAATMPAPVQAVHRALQYARCEGAVIVAAAGNKAGNECVPGPLAPALWENHPGPTRLACQADYATTPPGTWEPASARLVHAVAGVAYDDAPLYNARPDSRARLAAPAYVAVADRGGGVTAALTGSSVAAATVSGIVGLVWSYDPSLDPGAVLDRIHASGVNLGGVADFGQPGAVRRASACEALRHGCQGGSCPVTACPGLTGEVAALAAAVDNALATLPQRPPIDLSTHAAVGMCPAGCEEATLISGPGLGAACEDDLFGGQDRYTNPQPNEAPCKVCVLATDTLSMTVDDAYAGYPVLAGTLDISDGISPDPEHHRLGSFAGLSSTRVIEVILPPSTLPGPARSATLSLTFDLGAAGGVVTRSNAILVR